MVTSGGAAMIVYVLVLRRLVVEDAIESVTMSLSLKQMVLVLLSDVGRLLLSSIYARIFWGVGVGRAGRVGTNSMT